MVKNNPFLFTNDEISINTGEVKMKTKPVNVVKEKKKISKKKRKIKIKLSQTQMILARLIISLSEIDDDYYSDGDNGFICGPLGPEHESFIANSYLDWINVSDVNTENFKRKFLTCVMLKIAEKFNQVVKNERYNDNRIIGFELTTSEMINDIRDKLLKVSKVIALTDDYKNSLMLLYRFALSTDSDILEDELTKTYQKMLELTETLRKAVKRKFFNSDELPYDVMVYMIFQLGYILVSNDRKCKYLPEFKLIENITPSDSIESFMIKFGKCIRKNVSHSIMFTSFMEANPWLEYTFSDKNMNVAYGVLRFVSFFMDDYKLHKFIKNIKLFDVAEE